MLVFKFSEAGRIRQTVKAFNGIDQYGNERPARGVKRAQKVEQAFRKLIRSGEVRVIRRRGKPPLVRFLKPAGA